MPTMIQLRLPCLNSESQLLYYKQVTVYELDGVTPAEVFDLNDAPRSATFITNISGLIEFRVANDRSLSFREHSGLSQGPLLPLYTAGVEAPPLVEVSTQATTMAGATVFTGRALALDIEDHLIHASADNLSHLGGVVGIALQNGNNGDMVRYLSSGYVDLPSLTFQPGRPVFLGLDGLIVHSPVSSLFIQQLGVAVTPTRLMLNIGMPIKRG